MLSLQFFLLVGNYVINQVFIINIVCLYHKTLRRSLLHVYITYNIINRNMHALERATSKWQYPNYDFKERHIIEYLFNGKLIISLSKPKKLSWFYFFKAGL